MNFLVSYPTLGSIAGFSITLHGIFFALGAFISTIYLAFGARSLPLRRAEVIERALWIFLGGLISARLTFVAIYPDQIENLADVLAIWQGGLVSFGGVLGGFLVAWLSVVRLSQEDRWRFMDQVALATLLGWSMGRLGNYYGAESWGVVSTTWQLTYGRVPIQLFEAIGCLALFLYLRRVQLPPGRCFHWAITGYLIVRFGVDTWRDELVLAGLRTSQWVALFGLILVAVASLQSRQRRVYFPGWMLAVLILLFDQFLVGRYLSLAVSNRWLSLVPDYWSWTAALILVFMLRFTVLRDARYQNALFLVLAGAGSNLLTYVQYNRVVDYLPFFGWYLNVADLTVLAGIGVVLVEYQKRNREVPLKE